MGRLFAACSCGGLVGFALLIAAAQAETSAPKDKPVASQQGAVATIAPTAAVDAVPNAAAPVKEVESAPGDDGHRWSNGQIRFEGKWRTLDQVSQIVLNDRRWKQYDELRESMVGAPADHLELARWCLRNGLENEERYHWSQVLRVDPTHELARARLGVREYRGGLYTHQQVAEHEQQLAAAEKNFAKLKPIFTALCRQALDPQSPERATALSKLRQVDDPAAIDPLEDVISRELRNAPEELALELKLAYIGALANIPDHAATQKLLDYSFFSETPEVRRLAAQSLKPRPVTDYVPQLMASLATPIEAEIHSFASPDGIVSYSETLYQSGPLADFKISHGADVVVFQAGGTRGPGGGPGLRTHIVRAQMNFAGKAKAMQTRQQVELTNMSIAARNERVREVLKDALDLDFGADPRAYWQAWTDYNELYIPERPLISLADSYQSYYIPTMSCFAPGTPIWTQAGPRPIEHIVAGDIVLSQNPATGELAFRPVIETTLRPPSKMVRLSVGKDEIYSTLGHRFWIDGQGWEMAKFVTPAHSLATVDGPAAVATVEPLAAEEAYEAYNLVVDDFHTYFVGESRLLVHDNSCPRPTTATTPNGPKKGLAPSSP